MSWTPHYDSRFERLLFVGRDLALGRLELAADSAAFEDTGPTRHHVAVVPEIPVWVLRGEGEDEAEVADPGRLVLHNAGQPYRRRAIDLGDRCWWVALRTPAALGPGDPARQGPFDVSSVPLKPERLLEFHRIVDRLERDGEQAVERRLLGLLRSLVSTSEGEPPVELAPDHRRLAERARARIGASYRETVPMPRLAADVASSPSHLSRVFRRAQGQTLQDYRDDLRLRMALTELRRDPRQDLSALGHDLGYSSHSHFSASFRRRFACSPRDVRAAST